MTFKKLILAAALFAPLAACSLEVESEDVGEALQGAGGTVGNNVSPEAVGRKSLAATVTKEYAVTTTSNPDPLRLCQGGTVTQTGCVMKPEWENWLADNLHIGADNAAVAHGWMMKGIAKCAVESTFTIRNHDNSQTFPGALGFYPEWKDGRLVGQDKRERVSACILALLNGNNASLAICMIGPGGSPFSDACTDPNITNPEGGFFGDLFAPNPTAYVVGPDTDQLLNTGRICTSNESSYCCAEGDDTCDRQIVLAGAMKGSPQQNFANKRCNSFAMAGSFEYCKEFFSTEEPGRVYKNVFTTFVPVAQ